MAYDLFVLNAFVFAVSISFLILDKVFMRYAFFHSFHFSEHYG